MLIVQMTPVPHHWPCVTVTYQQLLTSCTEITNFTRSEGHTNSPYFWSWRLEAQMAELERPERLQIMLTADELAALENWRFEKRMPSRSAAVRELLRRGLDADGFLTAGQGTKSQDFGILSGSANGDGPSGD